MSIQTIKNEIDAHLQALVVDGTLGAATMTDIRKDPLSSVMGPYPHAFLMPPSIESEINDNRTLIRTYTFDIMVLFKPETLASTTELEEKVEAILNEFDNDPTLNGSAMAGVPPTSSSPQPIQTIGGSLIMVVVQVQAKELVTLTYS